MESFHSSNQVIDGEGKKLLTGFSDQHLHITGGGGEVNICQVPMPSFC